jgi:hypothetical protein
MINFKSRMWIRMDYLRFLKKTAIAGRTLMMKKINLNPKSIKNRNKKSKNKMV